MPGILAKLRPSNSHAEQAFHNVASLSLADARAIHVRPFMMLNQPNPGSAQSKNSDTSGSGEFTEPNTPTKAYQNQLKTMRIGCYVFKLSDRDPTQDHEWTAGSGTLKQPKLCQILLGAGGLNPCQVIFALSKKTGLMTIRAYSPNIKNVFVDGEILTIMPYSFNRLCTSLEIGNLQFEFGYSEYSWDEAYDNERLAFLELAYKDGVADTLHHTPTPSMPWLKVAGWTISKAIGQGTFGEVFSVTNNADTVAAMKVINRTTQNHQAVTHARRVLEKITTQANSEKFGHVLRLVDVYPLEANQIPLHQLVTEQVYFILLPTVACTWSMHIKTLSEGDYIIRLRLLQDLLKGIRFLHENALLHGDIKPDNTGISSGRAVLLDVDAAKDLNRVGTLPATPGSGGTLGWLAPEREMGPYGQLVDVWSAGVMALELFHNHRPWTGLNPWRPRHESLRPEFRKKYVSVEKELNKRQFLVDDLILGMLRYPHTTLGTACLPRVNIWEALNHECWKDL
ncbi:hypothetical protein HBI57_233750 [Parastagonospora nodorum]|nr:hypothetical protein HBI57_233750 [Parastagonospora nodorum]KAH6453223.1 hypothetical protein HBI58_207430 [Parastagonospora nodorum]